MNPTPKLIFYGGAWSIPEAFAQAHLRGVSKAAALVYPHLLAGASALDVVENAMRHLEADPTFDAGYGSFLTADGEVELDAMIMAGRSLRVGVVATVQNFLHPVSIARKVMELTQHCLLVGEGARRFALDAGFEQVLSRSLLTERELEFFEEIKSREDFRTHHPFGDHRSDTVGAVALDLQGNLATATSTGGAARKLPGRVGNSPIAGADGYAGKATGAVSAPGWGESILRVLLSKTVCDLFLSHPAMDAVEMGIRQLWQKVERLGGVIGINNAGEYSIAHNTPKMAFAFEDNDGEVKAYLQ